MLTSEALTQTAVNNGVRLRVRMRTDAPFPVRASFYRTHVGVGMGSSRLSTRCLILREIYQVFCIFFLLRVAFHDRLAREVVTQELQWWD